MFKQTTPADKIQMFEMIKSLNDSKGLFLFQAIDKVAQWYGVDPIELERWYADYTGLKCHITLEFKFK